MTISECIAQLSGLVQQKAYDNEQFVRWLYTLDCKIYNEIIQWRGGKQQRKYIRFTGNMPYTAEDDMDTDLLCKEPYTDIYIYYLRAQMSLHSGDILRYQNWMQMFNREWDEFAAWYNRTSPPARQNYIRY